MPMREKTESKPLYQNERPDKAGAVQIKHQFWFYSNVRDR